HSGAPSHARFALHQLNHLLPSRQSCRVTGPFGPIIVWCPLSSTGAGGGAAEGLVSAHTPRLSTTRTGATTAPTSLSFTAQPWLGEVLGGTTDCSAVRIVQLACLRIRSIAPTPTAHCHRPRPTLPWRDAARQRAWAPAPPRGTAQRP